MAAKKKGKAAPAAEVKAEAAPVMRAPKPAPDIQTVAHASLQTGQGVTLKASGKGAYFAGVLADDAARCLVRVDESGEWEQVKLTEIEPA